MSYTRKEMEAIAEIPSSDGLLMKHQVALRQLLDETRWRKASEESPEDGRYHIAYESGKGWRIVDAQYLAGKWIGVQNFAAYWRPIVGPEAE